MPDPAAQSAESTTGPRSVAVWGWVPQIFYDLIARIIPGTVLLIIFPITWLGPIGYSRVVDSWLSKPATDYPALTVFFVVLPFVSYALSTVALGLWVLALYPLTRWTTPVNVDFPSLLQTGIVATDDELPALYEEVKQADPSAGNRITKLKAELHMSAVLSIGFAASFVICCFRSATDDQRPVLLSFAFAFLGAVGAQWHFAKRAEAVARKRHDLLQQDQAPARKNRSRRRKRVVNK